MMEKWGQTRVAVKGIAAGLKGEMRWDKGKDNLRLGQG